MFTVYFRSFSTCSDADQCSCSKITWNCWLMHMETSRQFTLTNTRSVVHWFNNIFQHSAGQFEWTTTTRLIFCSSIFQILVQHIINSSSRNALLYKVIHCSFNRFIRRIMVKVANTLWEGFSFEQLLRINYISLERGTNELSVNHKMFSQMRFYPSKLQPDILCKDFCIACYSDQINQMEQ